MLSCPMQKYIKVDDNEILRSQITVCQRLCEGFSEGIRSVNFIDIQIHEDTTRMKRIPLKVDISILMEIGPEKRASKSVTYNRGQRAITELLLMKRPLGDTKTGSIEKTVLFIALTKERHLTYLFVVH